MERDRILNASHHYYYRMVEDIDEKLKFLNTGELEIEQNMRYIFKLLDDDRLMDMPQYLICKFERNGKTYLAFNKKYSAIDPVIYIEEKEFLDKMKI